MFGSSTKKHLRKNRLVENEPSRTGCSKIGFSRKVPLRNNRSNSRQAYRGRRVDMACLVVLLPP